MDESGKKILKALSYLLWPVALVAYLISEGDEDMKYHGAQGLTFGISLTIVWYIFYGIIPWILGYWFWRIGQLVSIAIFIIAILYAVKAYKGERFRIPIVYDIMKMFYKEGQAGAPPIMGAKP